VAANGSFVVFQSNGFGTATGTGVYSIPLGGGVVTPIHEDEYESYKFPMVSADGTWATWQSLIPWPDGGYQALRGRTDGSLVEMVTDDPDHGSWHPDISRDGRLVAYTSRSDPLGTNPDHNDEVFLHDAQRDTPQQLTFTDEGQSWEPRISDDGKWVYFQSSSPFFGTVPAGPSQVPVYRSNVAAGVIQRAGLSLGQPYWYEVPCVDVDADGGRAVYASYSTPTGELLPRTSDLWLADFETPATIRPSPEAPTVVEWDPDPRALHYDVIRGDVANLTAGPGNTVDLGTVVCLENDTVNTTTAGADADADQPAPGRVFFFLRRWTQGIGDTPSYGQGSDGAERVPSAGDCPQ
jgi:hypothetical protein